MYPTAEGTRVLAGVEADVFRRAVVQLIHDLHSDREALTGTDLFDNLERDEKWIMLASVVEPLLVEDRREPGEYALVEATIAAIFCHLETMIHREIGASSRALRKQLVEVWPERAPRSASIVPHEWFVYLEYLFDLILDDRDFLMEEDFMDAAPAEAQKLRNALGISEDYFQWTCPPATPSLVTQAKTRLAEALDTEPEFLFEGAA